MSPTPQAEIIAAADAALFAQFGEPVVIGLRSSGVYNPTTGVTSAAVYTSVNATAIIDSVTRRGLVQPSGGETRNKDWRVMVLRAGLPRAVAIGDRVGWLGMTIEITALEEEGYGGTLYAQHLIGRSV